MRAFSFAKVLNKASHAAMTATVTTMMAATITTGIAAANPLLNKSPAVESNNSQGFRLMQESLKDNKAGKNVLVSPESTKKT
jgi:serine protease inhibitor